MTSHVKLSKYLSYWDTYKTWHPRQTVTCFLDCCRCKWLRTTISGHKTRRNWNSAEETSWHRHGHRQNRLQLVAWGNHAQQQNTKRSISCNLRVNLQWITNGRGLAVWETLGQGCREESSSLSRLDSLQGRGVQLRELEPVHDMGIWIE